MANIYTKSMREALQEARDFRDTNEIEELDIEEGTGHLSYDEWLKKEKGIAKGAHGVNSDEHAKYSAEWRAYVKGLFDKLPPIKTEESNLEEIVGGQGHMTITQDDKVLIIKTKDWQTYKAKGWVKKTNESLDLSATGDTTTSNASQEVEGKELSEAWNEKLSKKGLEQYRTMYKSLSKSGIDTKWIKALEKLYDDIVIGGMYSSVSAEREGILKIDGRTKYKNANW
jgi:hypothetical protein